VRQVGQDFEKNLLIGLPYLFGGWFRRTAVRRNGDQKDKG
jgi:hypothetical protein